MRANRVVVLAPGLDGSPCVRQIVEQVLVEALVTQAAVEALDERVLDGLAGLDETELDAMGIVVK